MFPTPEPETTTYLCNSTLFPIFDKLGTDVGSLVSSLSQFCEVRQYPDESFEFRGQAAYDCFLEHAAEPVYNHVLDMPQRISPYGVTGFWNLPVFDTQFFHLLFWGDFASTNDGSIMNVMPGNSLGPPLALPQSPLENLLITVAFHRRLSKRSRLAYTQLVQKWLSHVSEQGLFGEGPVGPKSRHLSFFDKLAQFRVDASRTGQCSLNYFVLLMLKMCRHNPVIWVYFTERPQRDFSFAEEYGIDRQEPILTDLW